jgi:hypothetical protein
VSGLEMAAAAALPRERSTQPMRDAGGRRFEVTGASPRIYEVARPYETRDHRPMNVAKVTVSRIGNCQAIDPREHGQRGRPTRVLLEGNQFLNVPLPIAGSSDPTHRPLASSSRMPPRTPAPISKRGGRSEPAVAPIATASAHEATRDLKPPRPDGWCAQLVAPLAARRIDVLLRLFAHDASCSAR